MKNLLTILFLFTFSITGYNNSYIQNTKKTITEAYTYVDTSSLYKTMYNDAKSSVKALADAFKTTSEKILYIVAKKYFVEGIYNIIIIVFTLCFIFFFYKKSNSFIEINKSSFDEFGYIIINIFKFIPIILGLSFAFSYLENAIMYTFIPEYFVLQDVISLIKTFK